MSDPTINPELAREIQTTQEELGQYITRPPLLEKNLSKPPFRFLHDLVINVIEETGFMRGVFNNEEISHSTNFSTDEKRMFLNKLIITAMEATGESTDVRPSKILSGKEPEKTNNLLQLIARGIRMEIDAGRSQLKEKKESEKVEKRNKGQVIGAPGSKTNLEHREKIIPELISRNNKSSLSTTTTTANNARTKTKPGTKSQQMNSSHKIEPKIHLGNSGKKNVPDTIVVKPTSEKKPSEKQSGKKVNGTMIDRKSKSKSIKGQKHVDPSPKKAVKGYDEDDQDNIGRVCLADSSTKLETVPVTFKKSKLGLEPLRQSARLSEMGKSKSNSSSSKEKLPLSDIAVKGSVRARTKGKTLTNKPEEFHQQERPVTRAGFPRREDIPITIERDTHSYPTVWIEENKAIEVIQNLTDPLKILEPDIIDPDASGDDEVCNNLYNELCNPKATTPTEADISENEESQPLVLVQMGSDVSVSKSNSCTSLIATDEEFYRSSVPDAASNKITAKESTVSMNSVPEDQIKEESENEEDFGDEKSNQDQKDQAHIIQIRPESRQSRPLTARPSTARPPPPLRSCQPLDFNRLDDVYRPPEGRVTSVILDSNADEGEDDAFVAKEVTEADLKEQFSHTLANLILGSNSDAIMLPPPEVRGYLVDQIVNTQQELEIKKTESFLGLIDLDKQKHMSRDNYAEEIERLKNLIQLAARNANPIAKLLDYVSEDVHFMEGDLYRYRDENKRLDKDIELARQETEKSLEPLAKELEKAETKIQQKEIEISRTTMNILKLEERVANIIAGLDRVVPTNPRCIKDMLPSPEEVMRMVNSQGPYTSSGDFKRNSLIGIDLRRERTNDSMEIGGESGDYALPRPSHPLTNWSL